MKVRQRDIATILPDNKWLNDTIIDAFLNLIVAKQKLSGLSYHDKLPMVTRLFFKQISSREYYDSNSGKRTLSVLQ